MQIERISNSSFYGKFDVTPALSSYKASLNRTQKGIFNKQMKTIGKIDDGRTYVFNTLDDRVAIIALKTEHDGKEQDLPMFTDFKRNADKLFEALAKEYKCIIDSKKS